MNQVTTDITVIGGIVVDIEGNPYGQLVPAESNPGKISISYGGVGRNIVENLARLGASVSFVSATGSDFIGYAAVEELKRLGVNTEHIHFEEEEDTAMYLSILNIVGDMEMALCNMDVLERMSPQWIDSAMDVLKASKIVGLDTNLTEEMLDYVTGQLADVPLFLDPMSVAKAQRAKAVIGRFHTIKPNRMEAEALCGMQILSEEELMAAGNWFSEQGVKRIFITMGGGGVYYKEGMEEGILRPGPVSMVSATGVGDGFSAAILDGFVKGMGVEETARYAMAVAAVALESKTAVNPRMCQDVVKEKL